MEFDCSMVTSRRILESGTNKSAKRIAMKLIHRDSISCSPHSSPKAQSRVTLEDHIDHLMNISSARLMYLCDKIDGKGLGESDFQVDIKSTIQTSMFFVNFSIGQPPVPQFSLMDTGSSLLWVQCLPCRYCPDQTSPLLDPAMSSTFVNCPCHDPFCRYAPNSRCGSANECLYEQVYINGGGSRGVLGTERLTFTTPTRDTVVAQNVVFGCGHDNGDQMDTEFTGVMGLGSKRTSLAVQLGSKFSYCIGDLTDKDYSFNQLVLGEEADILGDPTPIETKSGIYFVNVGSISVGSRQLEIEPGAFTRRGPRTGVILDSGTLFTWLADSAYRELYNEIKTLLDGQLERYWYRDYLCYNGRVTEDLIGFPTVTFRFSGEAELALEATSLFYQMPKSEAYQDVFCMAIRPTKDQGVQFKDFTAIGLMAQQYYNIGYDLKDQKLYLQRVDCVLLNDYSPS
ncbi:PREDICTED: aspartic proteinase CDR1 [Tarenaya hassleriana]|uniref:aspartic proteinase CDR1 n=1 Tax=Tarenaya hassleriana TaxID=28532 RepID=UPI00053C6FD8|nr:PREDICTED: aspartic proteinase CDR1 [Tarenaya hassleriana]XP_010548585.1 PREDICTED: aspartic proteinase CDR1 [Tarenaya hassleriana]XP_010548586.1 PREDICTED: aspartic proteinase CDR1 [Tarenaya hassleriana]